MKICEESRKFTKNHEDLKIFKLNFIADFEPQNRRRRNLNRGDLQLEDVLQDVISLSTESDDDLSDEAMFESDNEEEDLNSDEFLNENDENDSDSQWSTEDE